MHEGCGIFGIKNFISLSQSYSITPLLPCTPLLESGVYETTEYHAPSNDAGSSKKKAERDTVREWKMSKNVRLPVHLRTFSNGLAQLLQLETDSTTVTRRAPVRDFSQQYGNCRRGFSC